jgi:hypothetical protein
MALPYPAVWVSPVGSGSSIASIAACSAVAEDGFDRTSSPLPKVVGRLWILTCNGSSVTPNLRYVPDTPLLKIKFPLDQYDLMFVTGIIYSFHTLIAFCPG